MDSRDFVSIRKKLGKTQRQLAGLLGLSEKAVQSIEQGWRNLSAQTERQLLFLLYLKTASGRSRSPCWVIRNCPNETRTTCPAWELEAGQLCWFVNGTLCHGKAQGSWRKKMMLCKRCEVFPVENWR